MHLTLALLSPLWICFVSEFLQILAFNCKMCLTLEALEAPVTTKGLSFLQPV